MSPRHAAAPVRPVPGRALLAVVVIAAMLLGLYCAEQLSRAVSAPAGDAAVAIAPPGGGDGPCAPADHGPERASRWVSPAAEPLTDIDARAASPLPATAPAAPVRPAAPVTSGGVSRLLAELCVWRT